MWNPFKRKYLVPVDECINLVIDAMKHDRTYPSLGLWEWLEARGVEHKWSWHKNKNYLVFDSREDYTMFLLKL